MSEIHLSVNEGEIFYKWCKGRIKNNKNVISATTGSTGSGKSYNDLRKAEIHYKNKFKEEFPIKNCCFSIAQLMERISSKELRKGEVLILEEAGVNSGSADWQNRIVKMFNYVLQSFRSMNIILLMNLPVLSMLSKQARQLVHVHMETKSIDFQTEKIIIKPLVHQLNQHSGKSYWKYFRTGVNGKSSSVTRISYSLPSPDLMKEYEKKKQEFLDEFTVRFTKDIEKKKDKENGADEVYKRKNELSPRQAQAYDLLIKGMSPLEASKVMNVTERYVHSLKVRIEDKKGIRVFENRQNTPTLLT